MTRTPELREHLQALQKELANTDAVDGDARELLERLLADIQSILDRSEEEEDPQSRGSLVERLENATREWETSHPTLATAIGRVMDTLANMGI